VPHLALQEARHLVLQVVLQVVLQQVRFLTGG
jgi:hypothetical protein